MLKSSKQPLSVQRKIMRWVLGVGLAPMAALFVMAAIVVWKTVTPGGSLNTPIGGMMPMYLFVLISLGFSVFAIFCLLAYYRIHHHVVKPVGLLSEGVKQIRQGDLDLKLKIDTGDEIEALALSFNNMAKELKTTLLRLGESEKKYRELVTSMREGIFQLDSSGQITFANRAAAETFGYDSPEQMIGMNYRQLYRNVHDYDRVWKELDEKGFVEKYQCWMQRADKQPICTSTSINKIQATDGSPEGIEGVFWDVTDRVMLEAETREKAQRLAVINEITKVINSTLDSSEVYRNIAGELKRLIKFDYAAICLLDVTGKLLERHTLTLETNGETADQRSFEVEEAPASRLVIEQGRSLLIEDREAEDTPAILGRFHDPEIRSWIGVPLWVRDRILGTFELGCFKPGAFTERDLGVLAQIGGQVAVAVENARLFETLHKSFEEVESAREKLEEANIELQGLDQMKTNLLSNVSHELRTPLVSIIGYTDMILSGRVGLASEDQLDYLSISLKNAEKLVALIDNLLDFSRLHEGKSRPSFETFDLNRVVEGSMNTVRPQAELSEVRLELASPKKPLYVRGDLGKIGQVFTNLLSNGIKFNRPGGEVVAKFQVSHEDSVNISVTDTGIGIPEEAQNKIFSRFYQVDDSSTRRYGGTGIGLAIAQDIVRLHGSNITVRSEPGEGSTFLFSLPLAETLDLESPTLPAYASSGVRLLIELVVQDRELSFQLKRQLEEGGLNVMEAVPSPEAVQLARRHHPDCIVTESAALQNGAGGLLELETAGIRIPIVLIESTTIEDPGDGLRQASFPFAARVPRGSTATGLLGAIKGCCLEQPHGEEKDRTSILVVDDDQEVLDYVDRALQTAGIAAICVAKGAEALEVLARNGSVGLVLLDIAMPEIDGFSVCHKIKDNSSLAGVKVCMMTAKTDTRTAQRAQHLGADGFLAKPFRVQELLECVREILPQAFPVEAA